MSTETVHPLRQAIADASITLTAVFVPYSQAEKREGDSRQLPTLNWQVTILHNGRTILTTPYSAGCAHCPAYKRDLPKYEKGIAVAYECENGKRASHVSSGGHVSPSTRSILPDVADVMYCLLSDANALNARDFKDWAGNCGYDTDSIKALETYRACLDVGLKLRNGLGDELFRTLQTAAQDY
jgi:hypothetical protein